MKATSKVLLLTSLLLIIGCSNNTIIELELTAVDGYGVFGSSLRMLTFNQKDTNDIWGGTQLKTTGTTSLKHKVISRTINLQINDSPSTLVVSTLLI
jgi:hypothetical protein